MDGPTGPMGPTPSPGLSLDTALQTVVEHYLLADLQTMQDEIPWRESGAVCYPMLISVIAGSELLGALTGGRAKFEVQHYWTSYMSRVNSLYVELGPLAQDILRNGLMHSYMTKPGVGVVRGIPDIHLTIDDRGLLLLDCVSLAKDFHDSYAHYARPHIDANRDAAQSGLDRVVREMTAIRAEKTRNAINEALFPKTRPTPNVARISGVYVPIGASQYPG